MHFQASQGVTRGILLGDYIKQMLRGDPNIPADLGAQSRGSRFFGQYCPGGAASLCRPESLPATDLSFAFEPG
jgi:hypothetical protein